MPSGPNRLNRANSCPSATGCRNTGTCRAAAAASVGRAASSSGSRSPLALGMKTPQPKLPDAALEFAGARFPAISVDAGQTIEPARVLAHEVRDRVVDAPIPVLRHVPARILDKFRRRADYP